MSGDDWWPRSIGGILEPFPFEIETAASLAGALEQLRSWRPEAVIVHGRAGDGDVLELIATLRREGLRRENPIILIPEQPLTREERVAALRAGAWDCQGPSVNGEELALKIQSYLGAARTVSAARQHALLDEASGLYNIHGILRWARELSHTAKRYSRPFGCAVFAPVEEPPEGSQGQSRGYSWDDRSRQIAIHLTSRGRSSDIVGRISASEYVVLAPDADPTGIMEMANRFVREGASETGSGVHLRAGCSAVSNLALESVEPAELIARATLALCRARTPEANVVEFFAGNRTTPN